MADKKAKAPRSAVEQYHDKKASRARAVGHAEVGLGVVAVGTGVAGATVGEIIGSTAAINGGVGLIGMGVENYGKARHEHARGRVINDLATRGKRNQSAPADHNGPQSWNQPGTARGAKGQNFSEANAHFEASHQMGPNAGGGVSEQGRGFANTKVQQAAQAARGRNLKES